jgi:hypothetical protein
MQAFHEVASDTTPKVPWNKGKLLGSKPPLQIRQVWAIRTKLQVEQGCAILRCLIWRSTANCEAAISSA